MNDKPLMPEALQPMPFGPAVAESPAPARAIEDCPKLTIVTPSYNQAEFLEATLRSVLAQGYPNLEYFVIDGGSNDGSVEVLKHYEPWLSGWVSEKDEGQTDAILKGLDRATGEWFNWINSDDLLAEGALNAVAKASAQADMIAGHVANFDENGARGSVGGQNLNFEALLYDQLGGGAGWHQPGVWLRTDWLKAQPMDRSLHYRFDYEMMLLYTLRKPRTVFLDDTLAHFRLHAGSKTVSVPERFRDEHQQILSRLSQRPELADRKSEIDLIRRKIAWRVQLEKVLADTGRSRWQRMAQLRREAAEDPAARQGKLLNRALRRLIIAGH